MCFFVPVSVYLHDKEEEFISFSLKRFCFIHLIVDRRGEHSVARLKTRQDKMRRLMKMTRRRRQHMFQFRDVVIATFLALKDSSGTAYCKEMQIIKLNVLFVSRNHNREILHTNQLRSGTVSWGAKRWNEWEEAVQLIPAGWLHLTQVKANI